MALISIPEVVTLAESEERLRRQAAGALLESLTAEQRSIEDRWFDIFLSHSYADKKVILRTKLKLEQFGHSVYVDWLVDRHLDRSAVTKENADVLRRRMCRCRCLLYVPSDGSKASVWMPWELGFMDGSNGRVAILPLTKRRDESRTYLEREYLGLYPYIRENPVYGTGFPKLWVPTSSDMSVALPEWLEGKDPYYQLYLAF